MCCLILFMKSILRHLDNEIFRATNSSFVIKTFLFLAEKLLQSGTAARFLSQSADLSALVAAACRTMPPEA
jgi:hypothetical protein